MNLPNKNFFLGLLPFILRHIADYIDNGRFDNSVDKTIAGAFSISKTQEND